MSAPRRVVPGIYMVQRRVVQRMFFLRPCALTMAVFAYCLAYAIEQTGVLVHELVVMSNHYHIVLSDPAARLPKFQQLLNAFVARALNHAYRRFGTFWERESFTAPELPQARDVIDKCVYALANPCIAHLVEHADEWPGLSSWSLDYGDALVAARPEPFGKDLPATISLCLVRPPVMLELDDAELRTEIRVRVIERELELRRKRVEARRGVLGVEGVMRQPIDARPRSATTGFGTRPRVSTRSVWAKVEAIQRNREWLGRYDEALKRYVCGRRDTVFPRGTYDMRVRFGVACDPEDE